MKKLYIFDIDDTLLIENKLSDETISALDRIKERGHVIVLCTGRLFQFIDSRLLSFSDYNICANGASLYKGDQVIYEKHIKGEVTNQLYDLCKRYNLSVAFRNGSGYHIPFGFDRAYRVEKNMNEAYLDYVFNDSSIEKSYNYFLYDDNQLQVLSPFCSANDLFLSKSFEGTFDIFANSISKGAMVKTLFNEIEVDEVIGFGNSENDLTFLRLCDQAFYLAKETIELEKNIKKVDPSDKVINEIVKELEL